MSFKKAKRRHSFLLLEMLLAVAMIGLCSSYLISTPMKVYQKHLEDFKKIELERIANHLFLDVQYHLKERHPWNTLTEEARQIYPLDSLALTIPSVVHIEYQCGYMLRVKTSKEGENETTYKLLECVVCFAPLHNHGCWEGVADSSIMKFSYLIFTSAAPSRKVV
jgi:hypothetical protein